MRRAPMARASSVSSLPCAGETAIPGARRRYRQGWLPRRVAAGTGFDVAVNGNKGLRS
jgi:hypothetical protein